PDPRDLRIHETDPEVAPVARRQGGDALAWQTIGAETLGADAGETIEASPRADPEESVRCLGERGHSPRHAVLHRPALVMELRHAPRRIERLCWLPEQQGRHRARDQ